VKARALAAFFALSSVAVPFALGALAARWWLARAPAHLAIDLAQPLVVVTAWGGYGGVCFAILALTIVCATIALLLAAGRLTSAALGARSELAIVVSVAALALACALFWPFVFSSDTYAYAAFGAMAQAGLDPYAPVPAAAHGAFVDAARWQWSGVFPVCVYGPVFVALARSAVRLTAQAGVGTTLWSLRGIAVLSFLASIALLGIALDAWPARRRLLALCAYGLNPVILWSVAEGHNDALVGLVLASAATLARCRGYVLAGLLLGLTPLLKGSGAVLAAGAALGTWLEHRPGWRLLVVGIAAGSVLAAGIALPPLRPALAALGSRGHYQPQLSLQGLVGIWPAIALAVLAAAYGVRRLWGSFPDGYAWLGIGLVAGLPNPYPWYALWIVPWAIAGGETLAAGCLWLATIFSVLRYLPDATGNMGTTALRVAAAVAVVPLALVLAGLGSFSTARKKAVVQP